MLFNSIEFAIFLPVVFLLYWFVFNRSLKLQNFYIVVVSYLFYGWWDWRFLILMAITTLFSWLSGIAMEYVRKENVESKARFYSRLISISNIILNLLILGIFKYYNFFIENFAEAFSFLGYKVSLTSIKLILPVGISFYTFQALSYSIDVYKGRISATNDIISFFAYVSFFPQLVAGPIERATHLLPQFYKKRIFSYYKAVDGLRQILWGLFKKIVVADNCAYYSDLIFNNSEVYSGSTLIIGAVFFAFQIYGDFSGYSDIAIGTSRLFGIDIMQNFRFPYFSRDVAEFWRRWHISLTTWFRDYIYIPIGGSKGGKVNAVRNTFIIFLISGFWHGANWTYILWGLINALYFLPLLLGNKNRRNIEIVAKGKTLPTIRELIAMSFTFGLTVVAWILFRAENVTHITDIFSAIFSFSLFEKPYYNDIYNSVYPLIFIFILLLVEWMGREDQHALERFGASWVPFKRYAFYYSLVFTIFWFGGEEQQFIYFQF